MFERIKIAIIVDDNDKGFYLRIKLEATGLFFAAYSTEPEHAIEFLKLEEPSLVLLGLGLPHTDGRDIYREMLRTEGLRDVPVLFLFDKYIPLATPLAMPDAGPDDPVARLTDEHYISRDAKPEDLVRRVKTLLGMRL